MPALAMATGAASTVNTLKIEMPSTARWMRKTIETRCTHHNIEQAIILTSWASGEIAQIQSAVEHFIAEAHEGQHVLLIVQAHHEILAWIEEFVRRFALHRRAVMAWKKHTFA